MDKCNKSSNDVKSMNKTYHLHLPLNPISGDINSEYAYNSSHSNALEDYINEFENLDYEKDEKWAPFFTFVEAEIKKSKITFRISNK